MAELLLAFRSTRQALVAEERLADAGIGYDVVPTPRTISAECGFALLMPDADRDVLPPVDRQGLYTVSRRGNRRNYDKID